MTDDVNKYERREQCESAAVFFSSAKLLELQSAIGEETNLSPVLEEGVYEKDVL